MRWGLQSIKLYIVQGSKRIRDKYNKQYHKHNKQYHKQYNK